VKPDGTPAPGVRVVAIRATVTSPIPRLLTSQRMRLEISGPDSTVGSTDARGQFVLRPPLNRDDESDTFPRWRIFAIAPQLREPDHEIWAAPDAPDVVIRLEPLSSAD
jgi:hypothetical protein